MVFAGSRHDPHARFVASSQVIFYVPRGEGRFMYCDNAKFSQEEGMSCIRHVI